MPMNRSDHHALRSLTKCRGTNNGQRVSVRCPCCRAKVYELMESGMCRECEAATMKMMRRGGNKR